jgi:hypothetical protein
VPGRAQVGSLMSLIAATFAIRALRKAARPSVSDRDL